MDHTVFKSGSSFVVVIPSAFADVMGVKAGDPVKVSINYEKGVVHYEFAGSKQLSLMSTFDKRKHI